MVMFTPSQSHCGGVIVKPYTGNIAIRIAISRGENRKKNNNPIFRMGSPVKSQMQTDEDLVVEFLELSLATVIFTHNDHALKVPMHCHRG